MERMSKAQRHAVNVMRRHGFAFPAGRRDQRPEAVPANTLASLKRMGLAVSGRGGRGQAWVLAEGCEPVLSAMGGE